MAGLDDSMRAAIRGQLTAAPRRKQRENVTTYRFNNGRPFLSDALGVNPKQIPRAREQLREHGIMVDFTEDGRAIIESAKQFRDVARVNGMWDGRDGYEVKDHDGYAIETGRTPARRREEFKRRLEREDW